MGSPPCEMGRGSENEVQVRLTHDFEIAAHETTQAEWVAVGFPNGSVTAGFEYNDCAGPECPVGNVTWFDALNYANRLSDSHVPPLTGCYVLDGCTGAPGSGLVCSGVSLADSTAYACHGYRLPTEAEWEYAARAGTKTPIYSGSMTNHSRFGERRPDPNLELIAWYCFNGGKATHPAARLLPNAWGLYDMIGNAAEWVFDEYAGLGYDPDSGVDPGGFVGNPLADRALRGGLVANSSDSCRAAAHVGENPNVHGGGHGFRLARTLP